MTKIPDLVTKRKEAYRYLRHVLRQPPWQISLHVSDAQLADMLGGTLELEDSLIQLREGTGNPSSRLVSAFKDLTKGIIAESNIDSIVVDPFHNV